MGSSRTGGGCRVEDERWKGERTEIVTKGELVIRVGNICNNYGERRGGNLKAGLR